MTPAELRLSRRVRICKSVHVPIDKRLTIGYRKSILQADASNVINIFEQTQSGPILFKIFFVTYIGVSTLAGMNELWKRFLNHITK